MAAQKAQKGMPLKDALVAYRAANKLKTREAAVLDRLASDRAAANAFETFALQGARSAPLITACIEADLILHTFKPRLDAERQMLGKTGRLAKLSSAVSALRQFVVEIYSPPSDRMTAYIRDDPQTIAAMNYGLYLLEDMISVRRRVAEQTAPRLGATRKQGGKAGETAAIGLIGMTVQRLCRRPHAKAAANLAQAVLGCVVTEERLREASRTRHERPWPPSQVVRSRKK